MIVDRKDYVQYMTVSKSHLDDCTCSLTEQKKALNDLYHDQTKHDLKIAIRFC